MMHAIQLAFGDQKNARAMNALLETAGFAPLWRLAEPDAEAAAAARTQAAAAAGGWTPLL